MAGCDCEVTIKNRAEARVLIILLTINAVMFVVELSAGLFAHSTALIADSLDMLADAIVYSISLYAVGRAASAKISAARLSGWFQISLGVGVFIEAMRRLIWGSEPLSWVIITVGMIALIANVICVILIARHRQGEVHMRASWIFSKNDVIANLGVIFSGALVYGLGQAWPDIVVGAFIAALVIWGGRQILRDARAEQQRLTQPAATRSCCSGEG
jgi:cation diffusion facilitator family transporter